jgi:uncharacterized protein (TIGR02147 family)
VETKSPVNIFEYLDYRQYLRDYYERNKATEYGFSHRAFSRLAGLRSSNFLKLVIDGQRNISPEMAERFARACHLQGQQAEFFSELVSYNQASTAQERGRCLERLSRFKQYREIHKLDAAQAAYHSTWYFPAIRELTAREDFSEDPRWISRVLRPKITPAQAKRGVDTLLELGLLERDATGRLRQSKPLITTGSGPLGHHIVDYHRVMMQKASEALDAVPREDREISSLTLCVSQKVMVDIKERIRRFRREILQMAEFEDKPERVIQINFQLFPLSEKKEDSND